MKYLIVKGCAGFGDRLQSLKMCVRYAIMNNVQIYVDWTDSIWSHNGESFYTYFKLINMPVLNSIDDIPEDATVFPPYWKGQLSKTITKEIEVIPELNLHYLQDQKFEEDVLVYVCNGSRYFYNDSSFFSDVFRVIDQRVIQKVRQRQREHNLKTKIGIHLRGTDRASKIDKGHRMAGLNIRLMGLGILNGTKFIAISDDADYIAGWKSRYREFPILTETPPLEGKQGSHYASADSLTVSKDTMNVNLLVDFFTLAACRSVLSTSNDSRFAQEAQRVHPHLDKYLS